MNEIEIKNNFYLRRLINICEENGIENLPHNEDEAHAIRESQARYEKGMKFVPHILSRKEYEFAKNVIS